MFRKFFLVFFIIILVSLAVVATSVCAESIAIPSDTGTNIDILNVKIGNTPDEVTKIIKKDYPSVKIRESTSLGFHGRYVDLLDFFYYADNYEERIRIMFTDPASTNNGAYFISRSYYPNVDKIAISSEEMKKSLLDKYGVPPFTVMVDSVFDTQVGQFWYKDGELVVDPVEYEKVKYCFGSINQNPDEDYCQDVFLSYGIAESEGIVREFGIAIRDNAYILKAHSDAKAIQDDYNQKELEEKLKSTS